MSTGEIMHTHPVVLLKPVFDLLNEIIRDYGLYIYMAMVWLSPFLSAWILSGGFWRKPPRCRESQRSCSTSFRLWTPRDWESVARELNIPLQCLCELSGSRAPPRGGGERFAFQLDPCRSFLHTGCLLSLETRYRVSDVFLWKPHGEVRAPGL
jgi:hypothetical protein